MARPKKQTVDYFPHETRSSRTMFILESKWGNDGYAFFYKLLELICSTNGHFINYNDVSQREFLLAKTKVSESTAKDILDTLAGLEKIDPVLWSKGVVWYQTLVDNVKDAYKKRLNELPQKPVSGTGNTLVTEFPAEETPSELVSGTGSTESKVKKSKVKETKKDIGGDYTTELQEALTAFIEMRKKMKSPMTDRAFQMLIKKLDGMTVDDSQKVAILDQSILNGWKDVYELKGGGSGGANKQRIGQTAGTVAARRDYSEYNVQHCPDPWELSDGEGGS